MMISGSVKSATAEQGTLQKEAVVQTRKGPAAPSLLSIYRVARLGLAYLKLAGVKPDCQWKMQVSRKVCKLDRQTVWKVTHPFSNLI